MTLHVEPEPRPGDDTVTLPPVDLPDGLTLVDPAYASCVRLLDLLGAVSVYAQEHNLDKPRRLNLFYAFRDKCLTVLADVSSLVTSTLNTQPQKDRLALFNEYVEINRRVQALASTILDTGYASRAQTLDLANDYVIMLTKMRVLTSLQAEAWNTAFMEWLYGCIE